MGFFQGYLHDVLRENFIYILDVLGEKNDVPNTAILLVLSQFHPSNGKFLLSKVHNSLTNPNFRFCCVHSAMVNYIAPS